MTRRMQIRIQKVKNPAENEGRCGSRILIRITTNADPHHWRVPLTSAPLFARNYSKITAVNKDYEEDSRV